MQGEGGRRWVSAWSSVGWARGAQAALVSSLPPRLDPATSLPPPSLPPRLLPPPVGEHLLMLPQLLESAMLSEESGDEAGDLVADWVDKASQRATGWAAAPPLLLVLLLASGVAPASSPPPRPLSCPPRLPTPPHPHPNPLSLPTPPPQVALEVAGAYQAQLGRLQGLSPQGAAQLGADLEYFVNVLATLGAPVPPALAAWQAAAAAPEEVCGGGGGKLGGRVGGRVVASCCPSPAPPAPLTHPPTHPPTHARRGWPRCARRPQTAAAPRVRPRCRWWRSCAACSCDSRWLAARAV